MARPRKLPEDRRAKWPVLNVTAAERDAITAAAAEVGLGISEYILACTRQTVIVRRSDHVRRVQLLAGIEARLEEIARAALDSPLTDGDMLRVLMALRAIETAVWAEDQNVSSGDEEDDSG